MSSEQESDQGHGNYEREDAPLHTIVMQTKQQREHTSRKREKTEADNRQISKQKNRPTTKENTHLRRKSRHQEKRQATSPESKHRSSRRKSPPPSPPRRQSPSTSPDQRKKIKDNTRITQTQREIITTTPWTINQKKVNIPQTQIQKASRHRSTRRSTAPEQRRESSTSPSDHCPANTPTPQQKQWNMHNQGPADNEVHIAPLRLKEDLSIWNIRKWYICKKYH